MVQIRPGRPDHPDVSALLAELDRYLASLYAPEANHILDLEALKSPEVDFLVAACGAQTVGCGATRRAAGADWGEVKRMFVLPAHRGRHVASRLLATLEQRLAASGASWARLETGRDQPEALRLYERSGYRRCGAFGGYPDNGLSVFLDKRIAP
ncbi:MAG: GNAT family N-acetyltransferase [Rubrivivax sp.]|nr:GNAT family N-acetyltransferase [Rubrivivax sp.]MDH5338444.1 GNAT family N-acetyltransferase [Rubrivivax sp.]